MFMQEGFAAPYTGGEGKGLCEAGCLEDDMFSKASRAPQRLELIYSGENLKWCEDEAAAACRQGERKHRILATCIAFAFSAIVLGHSFGVAWLLCVAAGAHPVTP